MSQFFTPPVLTIRMLEKFENLEGTLLDPTYGAGGFIAAAIIAGADPKKCYGIELDPDVAALARARLAKLGVPRHHIHVGNALESSSYEFEDAGKSFSLSFNRIGKSFTATVGIRFKGAGPRIQNIVLSDQNGQLIENAVRAIHKIVLICIAGEFAADQSTNQSINMLNSMFVKFSLALI